MKFKFGRLLPIHFYFLASAALIIVAGVTYTEYRLGLRPVSAQAASRTFIVQSGDNVTSVAEHLSKDGLIRSTNSFITYVNFHGLRGRLKAGNYELSPAAPASAIAETLTAGRTAAHHLVVPEGYHLIQIEKAAAAQGIAEADFKAALAAPHTQSFLSGKPANVSLEGYLFPDSYQVDSATTAPLLINAMLDNFGTRVGPEYVQAFAAQGLTLHQGLTLASVVEREVNIPADRPIVAQIFLKRFKSGQTLGSDVTAVYAAELLNKPFDINLDSPYNTRRYPGLPPGPICSPGLSALDAVAHPATTDYLYFLTGKDGKTYFAKTYAQHQQNIAKYL
ncbi:MAG: endolytic transglycosylase MltG [Candidatus Saccharimonadales bacterium]